MFCLWIFIVAVYRGICLCLHCETSPYIFLPFLLCNLMDSRENKRNLRVSRSVGLLLCNGDFREKQTPYRSGYNVFIFARLRLKTWTFLEKNSVMWYYHSNGDAPETQNKDWFVRCWHIRFVLASVHLALRCSFVMCVLRFCLFLWEEDTIRREWGWEWGEGAGKIALHKSSLHGPLLTGG